MKNHGRTLRVLAESIHAYWWHQQREWEGEAKSSDDGRSHDVGAA